MLESYEKLFTNQKMMRKVLIALAPLVVLSVFFYGWRTLAVVLINIITASVVEYICEKKIYSRGKISEASIVSAVIFSLTLPPSIPFWISAVGIGAGIFFGKELFGGFGRNVFNPAIVGRVFVYVNFPNSFTMYWNQAANPEGFFSSIGGFSQWLTPAIDATSTATPLMIFSETGQVYDYMHLILGNISGSIGETAKIFIILGGIYLVVKKVASWEIILSQIIGFVGTSLLLIALGSETVANPIAGMLMGGFLFGAVFMSTDPISAPKTSLGKWTYGILIGAVVVLIRGYSLYSGGMMFAILLGNVFSPIVDYVSKQRQKKKEQVSSTNAKAVK